MHDLTIRKYINNDFKEVIKLLQSHFNIDNNIKDLDNNDYSYGIVAITNKMIVGYIRIDKLKDIGKNCYYYLLNYVCVNSNYQNMNIATKLLEFIFNEAKKNNIKYIELTSNSTRKAANHLYLKNNFIIKDTNVFIKKI